MLEELMNEIRQGGTLDVARLASRLDTSPQMVQAMLEYLRRVGVLLAYESCAETCVGCSQSQACSWQKKDGRLRLWQSVR